MKKNGAIVLSISMLLVASVCTFARLIHVTDLPSENDRADLTVCAEAISSTDIPADILGTPGKDLSFGVRTGVDTRFRVLLVVKGDPHLTKQEIVVHHYKLAKVFPESRDQPRLVHFDAKHTYLLCLLHKFDGRYEPTTGQIDPVDSVWELKPPTPNTEPAK